MIINVSNVCSWSLGSHITLFIVDEMGTYAPLTVTYDVDVWSYSRETVCMTSYNSEAFKPSPGPIFLPGS